MTNKRLLFSTREPGDWQNLCRKLRSRVAHSGTSANSKKKLILNPFGIIGGFRGGKRAMPPRCKSPFFVHMQCVINLCSKTNKIYTQYMHFRGFSSSKSVCFRCCAPATGPYPRSSPLFSVFGLNFWSLGASSPHVTPISGYACVRLRNNKQ